jgi:hypothetical protein
LGQLIIRNLGDTGGPPTDRVSQELDSIIAWAKLSPRIIKVDTSTVNSTGAGPDTLHTFSLPANSLATDGDFVEVEYGFLFAANDNDKGIRGTFGGTEYARRGLGATDLDGTVGGVIRATIARLSSTSVIASSTMVVNVMFADSAGAFTGTSGNGGITFGSCVAITGLANLNSNATTMNGQSLGVAGSDVTQRLSVIKLFQQ